MIRVFIETASSVTRAGLESLIETTVGLEWVASLSDADVVLADEIPRQDGGSEPLPSVVLSDARLTSRLVGWGVRAVLPRDAPLEQIAAAIQAAAAGLIALPAESGSPLLPIASLEPVIEHLTPRELEVLEMLAEGLGNKQIAAHLSISDHTAKFHVNSILNKLGAGTRTEAVMRALRRGILRV